MLNLIEAIVFLGLLSSTAILFWRLKSARQQLAQQQPMLEQLEHHAYYDELTQLPNQLYFEKHLAHVIARSERSKVGFAVLYIDLDNFKPFNDQYGHRMGDKVLVAAAAAIRQSLRQIDFPARYSSDEFVVVLEEAVHIEVLQMITRRLLDNIYKATQSVDGDHTITASIGISCYSEPCGGAREMIDLADHAMYSAKQSGKNCYVFAQCS